MEISYEKHSFGRSCYCVVRRFLNGSVRRQYGAPFAKLPKWPKQGCGPANELNPNRGLSPDAARQLAQEIAQTRVVVSPGKTRKAMCQIIKRVSVKLVARPMN